MAVVGSAVQKGFGVALDRSQGRTEFVGDVGDEVAASFFDALGFGKVAEDGDGSAAGQRGRGDVEGASGEDGDGAGGRDLFAVGGTADGGKELRIADRLNDGSIQASTLRNEAFHAAIGPLDAAIGTDGDDGVLHGVQQSF